MSASSTTSCSAAGSYSKTRLAHGCSTVTAQLQKDLPFHTDTSSIHFNLKIAATSSEAVRTIGNTFPYHLADRHDQYRATSQSRQRFEVSSCQCRTCRCCFHRADAGPNKVIITTEDTYGQAGPQAPLRVPYPRDVRYLRCSRSTIQVMCCSSALYNTRRLSSQDLDWRRTTQDCVGRRYRPA